VTGEPYGQRTRRTADAQGGDVRGAADALGATPPDADDAVGATDARIAVGGRDAVEARRVAHGRSDAALSAFLTGIAACDGTKRVKAAVRSGALDDWFGDREHPRPLHVLAIGKAAPAMTWGLMEANVPFTGIGVTAAYQRRPQLEGFRWCVGDHPRPRAGSFAAGASVLAWADALSADARVLVLLSGGASALMEAGDEARVARVWDDAQRTGLDIASLNARRAEASAIKGGRLGRRILARTPHLRVWLIADTPPDAAQTVGSAPFWQADQPDIAPHTVLADTATAVAAAGADLVAAGYAVFQHGERLAGRVEAAVASLLLAFDALPDGKVALVGGGEVTLALPTGAPPGGRNQHAALVAARHLAGRDVHFLAASTDGVDGTTREAGAAVDGATWSRDPVGAAAALARFDAHGWLAAHDATVRIGPTATNVADLWIALRS
jgi:hydroxypyruvate reductase